MLNAEDLARGIQRVFDLRLEDKGQIAFQIALEYQKYAATAQGPAGTPVILTGMEYSGLKDALANLMNQQLPAPAAANMIAAALMRFWLSPPVVSTAPPILGTCTVITPPAAIAKMVSTSVDKSSDAAASLAKALDIATKTVIVTYTAPPPPAGPPPPGPLM